MTSTVADQVRLYVVRGTAGEISEGIRNLISAGVLAPGDALPPIRALADDLEVHRNTVAGAYRLLVAAGVVETQGRRGSFVRAIPFLEDISRGVGVKPRSGGEVEMRAIRRRIRG